MILADTCVWVDHLRSGSSRLSKALEDGEVLCHPFVVGELTLGALRQRSEILSLLTELPQAIVATADETLSFILAAGLSGRGVGYVDGALLASARLTPGTVLWTLDRRLAKAAEDLGVGFAR
ncbi:MAG: type II toxin-antitoxin system VapC family toxin [Caulobacteraceae bacterium]|nr:type II toxin-antitoxin system VapC family toxin [Caulobacteraceae bacterium]